MKDKILNFLLLLCVITIIISLLPLGEFKKELKQNYEKIKKVREAIEAAKPVTHKFTININEVELSYKTKEEILNLRKNYVNNSIFASKNYKPSEELFGQIVDGKPWIANNYCLEDGKAAIDGISMRGLPIANPELLVIIEFPYVYNSPKTEAEIKFCKHFSYMLKPRYLIYDKGRNEIEIGYEKLERNVFNGFYQLNGINARDFGYEYVYLDKNKTNADLIYYSKDNFSNEIVKFQDFFHLGHACKQEGGCNNISPFQGKLQFKPNPDKYLYDEKIYLKLWKNRPNSPNDKADINVIFSFK